MPSSVTEEETQLVQNLKEFLEASKTEYDEQRHDDGTLLRFLRARGLDIKKAASMFQKSLLWRQEKNVDTLVNDLDQGGNPYFKLLKENWPAAFIGKDKEGIPVFYERIGILDPRLLLKLCDNDSMINYHIYCQEVGVQTVKDIAKETNKPFTSCIVVEDMQGLCMKHIYRPAIAVLKQIIGIDEANYPEILKKYYIINAPKVFAIGWGIIKPWIDKNTLEKVKIFASGHEEELLKEIESDQLPVQYGGTLECSLPGEESRFRFQKDAADNNNDYDQCVIPRKSKHEVPIEVTDKNAKVYYEFETKGYDLGFGVSYTNDKGEEREFKPIKRVNSHSLLQMGYLDCEEPGRYTLIFDNSFSMTKKKQLSYKVELQDS